MVEQNKLLLLLLRPTGETSTFNLHELRNDMPSQVRQDNFELGLRKSAKYYRNNMPSEVRQKNEEKLHFI